MGFFKEVEIKDAEEKYGFSHQGVFAKEPVKKGEAIFTCDLSICDYVRIEEVGEKGRTKEETLRIFRERPDLVDFIHKYSYMVDDDLYDWPRGYLEQKLTENCMFFNHSCDPNCGFQALDSSLVVAIRDIAVGEELTYDYQFMDTESSFYDGIHCRCGSFKCRGVLRFDQYRNVDWQNAYYKYSGAYVKRKIDELKTKWYSSRCYLKYYYPSGHANDRQLGLTALQKIRKDDLVALYQEGSPVAENSHYIRHSDDPTCYLENNEVYAARDIEPQTELTLKFSH